MRKNASNEDLFALNLIAEMGRQQLKRTLIDGSLLCGA